MITIIAVSLLAVIAIVEVHRSYTGLNRTTSRKSHFKRKLEGTKAMIWDLQFKVFKTREIREDIRQEYDQMKSRIDALDTQIKNWPSDQPEAERKAKEDQKVLAERDAERFLLQMKMLDEEVEGAKPTAENPDGKVGIVNQIDSLRELEGMLKDYIKEL